MRVALVLLVALVAGSAAGAAVAQTEPVRRTTESLLNALKVAPSEEVAAAIEGQLRGAWMGAASPAVKLLLSRGQRELSEGSATEGFDSYAAALDLEPELLEAWRGRAAARSRMGDTQGAVRDLQEIIRREPRNFMAWQDLSRVAEARGDWRGAFAAWQKLLEVDPHTPGGQARLRDLRRRALGEDA